MMAGFPGLPVRVDVSINDSNADRAMNKAACNFLSSDCDLWLNIDADIDFTAEHVRRLIAWELPLVYGIYPKKEEATNPCLSTFEELITRDDGLMEVKRCGRGFMCVRREVLEKMKDDNGGPAEGYDNHGRPEWDFFHSGVVNREWLSEDWRFCDRARALGIPVLVDPRIVLGHEGCKMYRFGDHQVTGREPVEDAA